MQTRILKGLLVAAIFSSIMSAQPPTVVVNDSLSEVRIFPNTSPDFSKVASSLGVDASLSALGENLPLVVALRNDSGEAVDSMRIIYQIHTKDGRAYPRIALHGPLAAGASVLTAPEQLGRAVAALKPQQPGTLSTGRTNNPALLAQNLKDYQGAEVTISIDSATLASGRFLGADTLNWFARLVDEDTRRKKFFADLANLQSNPELPQILKARQAAADQEQARGPAPGLAGFNPAAMTESMLCQEALMRIRMGTLAPWVSQQNAQLQSKPTIHR